MDQKVLRKWVRALRSGKYRQGRGSLYAHGRYCCLGVLATIQGCSWKGGEPQLNGKPVGLRDEEVSYLKPAFAGIAKKTQETLSVLNDGERYIVGPPVARKSFKQIADYIEKHLAR